MCPPLSPREKEREGEVRRKGEAEGERERLSKDSPVFPHLLSLHPPRNDRSTRNFKLQRTRYPAVQLSQVINSLDVLSLSLSSTSTKSNPPSRVHAPTIPSSSSSPIRRFRGKPGKAYDRCELSLFLLAKRKEERSCFEGKGSSIRSSYPAKFESNSKSSSHSIRTVLSKQHLFFLPHHIIITTKRTLKLPLIDPPNAISRRKRRKFRACS